MLSQTPKDREFRKISAQQLMLKSDVEIAGSVPISEAVSQKSEFITERTHSHKASASGRTTTTNTTSPSPLLKLVVLTNPRLIRIKNSIPSLSYDKYHQHIK